MTGAHHRDEPIVAPTPRWLVDAAVALDPPQADVERLTRSVISATRRFTHPRRTLHTDSTDIVVTDHVVRRLVHVRVRGALARPVLDVAVVADAGIVSGVRVDLAAQMGDDLIALANLVRATTNDTLVETLGRGRGGTASSTAVQVNWSDLLVTQDGGTRTESTR